MEVPNQFKFSPWILAVPLYFVLALWVVYWFEVRNGYNFNTFGILPRTLIGLRGIILSPFIHGDIKHLYHNSAPLFVLLFSLLYFYRDIAWKVFIYGTLCSGFITWLIARKSYHIGASGIVYLLFSFIFFSGIIRKNYRLVAVSLMVIFLYGSMVWYTMPIEEGISWEGHLSGLIVGFLFAIVFKKDIAKPKKYVWEQDDFKEEEDPFLKHFDEDGNFIDDLEPKEAAQEINYIYKENQED